jgi:sec-independent protein translocase protein TatB
MFGMGMGEILIIAIVALLALGPDKLPEAAKKIGETIRGLRRQTSELRKTIEEDTQLGDAMKEIRSALREDPRQAVNKAVNQAVTSTPERPAVGPAPEESALSGESLVVPADDAVARDDGLVGPTDESAVAGDAGAGATKPAATEPAATEPAATEASSPAKNGTAPAKLSDYEKYIHNNGTEAAAEKFGTSVEHAEAAMMASLERATSDG